MKLDPRALHDASADMFSFLGDLDDLGAELANTVANVYYRFYWTSYNPGLPLSALGVSDSIAFLFEKTVLTDHHARVEDIVNAVRRATHPRNRQYLTVLALDVLKYRIDRAGRKSALRRSVERRFKKVKEFRGLYRIMQSHRRRSSHLWA